jgi:hypothetical protein
MCLVIPEEIDSQETEQDQNRWNVCCILFDLCITRHWSTLPLKYTFKSSWCTCSVIKIACETNTTPLKICVTYFHLMLEWLYIIDYLIQHHSFSCDLHASWKKIQNFFVLLFSIWFEDIVEIILDNCYRKEFRVQGYSHFRGSQKTTESPDLAMTWGMLCWTTTTLLQPGTRSCKYFIRSLIFSLRTCSLQQQQQQQQAWWSWQPRQ